MTDSYAMRVEEGIRHQVAIVVGGSRLGLASTTCVVRAQMARAHEMLLSCAREEPNDESFDSISQTRVMMASGSLSRFKDADDMFASLGI